MIRMHWLSIPHTSQLIPNFGMFISSQSQSVTECTQSVSFCCVVLPEFSTLTCFCHGFSWINECKNAYKIPEPFKNIYDSITSNILFALWISSFLPSIRFPVCVATFCVLHLFCSHLAMNELCLFFSLSQSQSQKCSLPHMSQNTLTDSYRLHIAVHPLLDSVSPVKELPSVLMLL